jgi:hypothetical protein
MTRTDAERFDRQLLLLRSWFMGEKVLAMRLNLTKTLPLEGGGFGWG